MGKLFSTKMIFTPTKHTLIFDEISLTQMKITRFEVLDLIEQILGLNLWFIKLFQIKFVLMSEKWISYSDLLDFKWSQAISL